MRVLAAMSGGVDSAVAAARALDAGHDVTGVHLALSRMPGTVRSGSRGCCTVEDALDARRVADQLGIPFYVWDFSAEFTERVVDDFVSEYQHGRTPNPCMRCNERIKFSAVMDRALDLGFDAVATGHYARVVDGLDGPELHRAGTWAKDQSYVLGVLTEEQLRHSLFPLGDEASKADVRAEAERRGFTVSAKPDSHDICFIPDGDTRGWLEERLGRSEGPIVDTAGSLLGSHPGTAGFTVGQRKGLHIGRPAADGRPRFVLEVRPADNTVVVGSQEELAIDTIAGTELSWCGSAPPEIEGGVEVDVQIRAHADPVPALARLVEGEIVVTPVESMFAVAPGQTAVLYSGTRVLGQFTIARTVRAGGGLTGAEGAYRNPGSEVHA